MIRLAIQKSGRLNKGSLNLLTDCGISIENGEDQLKVSARNFPIEIFFLRNSDIPQYLKDGVVDLAIVGENLLKEKEVKLRIHNTQGSVKNKHYGKLILLLIKEAVKIKDPDIQNYAVNQIAQQMKRAYLNWNQTNVQDIQIWNDLEKFSEKKLDLDKTKIIPVFQVPTRKKTFFKKNNKKNYSKK